MLFGDLQIPLFDGLDSPERQAIAGLATLYTYHDGETIVREGDNGKRLYIVACGSVSIAKQTIDGDIETLATLAPGECFGEMSLVDPKPRSATVRANGSVEVIALQEDALDALLAERTHLHLTLLKNVARITSERLRFGNDSLVQSAYDTVIEIDAANRIKRLIQLTGCRTIFGALPAAGSVKGRRLSDVVPGLGEGICAQIDHACASGERTALDLEFEHDTNELGFYQVTVAPGDDPRCPVSAIIGIRDVTESKTLEARLIQAEKLAMTGQRSAEIGHELRNYLTVLVSHVELLKINPGVEKNVVALRSLGSMQEQLKRVEQFATGLMDLGIMKLKKEPSNLNALIENLIDFIRGQKRFRHVAFETDLADELPLMPADPGQIHQVLMNLYANAADAMESGVIRCRTGTLDQGSVLYVEVEDNGPGIPISQLENIFECGFTTKDTGHGFGLAVCRRIVENHQGSIEVRNRPCHGSIFRISFRLDELPSFAGTGEHAHQARLQANRR